MNREVVNKQIVKIRNILLAVMLFGFGLLANQPVTSAAPFTCESGFYQSMTFGVLKRLNVSDGTYQTIGGSSASFLNAIGYNIEDNYIYGINNTTNDTLVRIENDATTTDLGTPSGLSAGNYVAGDMDQSGNLYTTDGTNLWTIDVSSVTANSVVLSTSLSGVNDLVFIDGYLYATNGTNLYQVDISNGNVVTKSLGLTAGVYGAGWASSEGKLYFSQNVNGIIYEILDYEGSPEGVAAYAGEGGLAGNDGAACSLAASVIEPINAVDDHASTLINTPLIVDAAHGLLQNDTPEDVEVNSYTQPSHGSVVVNQDGSYTYTPSPGLFGSDSFTYTIINSVGEIDTATVFITVNNLPEEDSLAGTGISQNVVILVAIHTLLISLILGIVSLNRNRL